VLRELNKEADKEANLGSTQLKGQLQINEETSYHPIP